jgi:uncharacterized protein
VFQEEDFMRHLLLSAALALATLPATAQVQPDLAQDSRVADGRELFLGGDEAAGLAILMPEAEAGHPRAQNIVGAAYQYGRGVPVDAVLAQQWLGRAADQGFPAAIHNLGVLFELGMEGLPSDLTRARAYYRQAAALDYGPSLGEYGQAAYEGTGGPVDLRAAVDSFRRGAELGDRLATEWFGYVHTTGEGVDVDLAEARRLYQISALMGSSWAQNEFGQMLEQGDGGPQDMAGALAMYEQAVAGDEAYAGINAAWLIIENPEVFPDQVQGAAYCLWAVDNAPADAATEWRTSCDDLLSDLTPAQLTQARKEAASL